MINIMMLIIKTKTRMMMMIKIMMPGLLYNKISKCTCALVGNLSCRLLDYKNCESECKKHKGNKIDISNLS